MISRRQSSGRLVRDTMAKLREKKGSVHDMSSTNGVERESAEMGEERLGRICADIDRCS